jgi:hypothetical protein
MKKWVHFLVLLVAALAFPSRSSADSFTLSVDGSSPVTVTALSFSVSSGQHPTDFVTVVIPIPDPLGTKLPSDVTGGAVIPSMTVDVFKLISGVSTLVETLEFDSDAVTTISFNTQGSNVSESVTFAYVTEIATVVGGGGGPGTSSMPEPSALTLLGIGVAGLCCLRKKQSV